jgi:hypothetical protein
MIIICVRGEQKVQPGIRTVAVTPLEPVVVTGVPVDVEMGSTILASRPKPPEITDCFLSHNWGMDEDKRDNHARVVQINRALQGRGIRTWCDEDQMSGDVLQRIMEGIDHTSCVLVFVTQRYKEKINGPEGRDFCKIEFESAFRKLGPQKMIPIIMDNSMLAPAQWTGMLGVIHGNLYVNMSASFDTMSSEEFEKHMDQVCKQINAVIGH